MRALIAVAAAVGAILAPSVALASGSGNNRNGQKNSGSQGVHVDPGSPAGHEYAIPVSGARGETSGGAGTPLGGGGSGNPPGGASPGGGTGNPSGVAGNPPPFGVGITPSSSSSAAGAGRSTRSTGAGASGTSTRPYGRAGRVAAAAAAQSRSVLTAAERTGGPSDWLILLGGAVLVPLVAVGGGLAMKRAMPRT